MYRKRFLISLISGMILAGVVSAETDTEQAALRIYLPREITIQGDTPTLGQVAILRGSEKLTNQAALVTLGHLSVPDQDLVVNQTIVLSRLACSGIDVSDVALTGAKEVTVKRQHLSITGDDFVTQASDFLKNNLPNKAISKVTPVRRPQDLVTSGSVESINLVSQIISLRGNQCKVRTTAMRGKEKIASRDTVFLCQYKCRKAIAKVAIEKGQTLSQDNITLTDSVSNTLQPADWQPPYGQIAKRSFAVGAEIESYMVAPAAPSVILKRNQTVAIKINRPGFVASAVGKALQDGVSGEYIKVQNINSQKIIMAKVIEDGTVEPVF